MTNHTEASGNLEINHLKWWHVLLLSLCSISICFPFWDHVADDLRSVEDPLTMLLTLELSVVALAFALTTIEIRTLNDLRDKPTPTILKEHERAEHIFLILLFSVLTSTVLTLLVATFAYIKNNSFYWLIFGFFVLLHMTLTIPPTMTGRTGASEVKTLVRSLDLLTKIYQISPPSSQFPPHRANYGTQAVVRKFTFQKFLTSLNTWHPIPRMTLPWITLTIALLITSSLTIPLLLPLNISPHLFTVPAFLTTITRLYPLAGYNKLRGRIIDPLIFILSSTAFNLSFIIYSIGTLGDHWLHWLPFIYTIFLGGYSMVKLLQILQLNPKDWSMGKYASLRQKAENEIVETARRKAQTIKAEDEQLLHRLTNEFFTSLPKERTSSRQYIEKILSIAS